MAQIAQNFDGAAYIEKTNTVNPGVTERYEGFTRLLSVSRDNEDGIVLVTLEAAEGISGENETSRGE